MMNAEISWESFKEEQVNNLKVATPKIFINYCSGFNVCPQFFDIRLCGICNNFSPLDCVPDLVTCLKWM